MSGSLTDIVQNGRMEVAHSWHADSGLPSCTVMVGFPDRDRYSGAGVFSHVARTSHPLRDQKGRGAVIEWERFQPAPGPIPEEFIVRPGYRKARAPGPACLLLLAWGLLMRRRRTRKAGPVKGAASHHCLVAICCFAREGR